MTNDDLTLLQKEISAALRQLKNRNLITEAQLIKKIRENVKFFGKNKASLTLNDIEIAIKFLEETEKLFFSIHCNSANDLFFKPEESPKEFEQSHKQRRLKSEKSMNLLTSKDLQGEKSTAHQRSKKTSHTKRTQRTSLSVYGEYEE